VKVTTGNQIRTPLAARSRRSKTLTSTRVLACGLFSVVFAVHCLVVAAVGTHGWDDGSITAAFAKTFADTGHIALTPFSEVVEGFSSFFWFILLTVTFRVIPLSFDGMVAASQLWAAVFSAVGAVILFGLLRRVLPRAALPLSFAIFASAAFLSETGNGMEMTALSALALATVWVIKQPRLHPIGLISLAALAPWVRFEAGGYFVVAGVALAVLARDHRRAGCLAGGAMVSLAVLSALRLVVFGSPVPNTLLAKRWAPYPKGGSIGEQIFGAKFVAEELIFVLTPAAIIVVVALVGSRLPYWRGRRARLLARRQQPVIAFVVGYVVAAAGFNVAIGPNWGYFGRMELSILPLMVVLVVYSAPRTIRGLEAPWRLAAAFSALLVFTFFGLGIEGLAPSWHPERSDKVTPAAMRSTGQAVDELRIKLGLPTATVLMPDVGGSGLCCRQLTILDLGLLTNHDLAQKGYASLGELIETRRPDVVQTHSVWSTASGIYDLAYFRQNYTPVVVNRSWLYVRNDHLAALAEDCHPAPPNAADFIYAVDTIDRQYVQTLGGRDVCQLD
jgi:hypothetical protein